MKYTTFRNTLLAGGILAAAGGYLFFGRATHSTQPQISGPRIETTTTTAPPSAPVEAKPSAERGASPATGKADVATPRGLTALPQAAAPATAKSADHGAKTPLREMDREIIQLVTQPQAAKPNKGKDVFPKRPYKVNLYVEGDRVVRAKVDLNRNGKWDEKWSFEADGATPVIKRQVSPADDDTSYTLTYKVAGEAWVQK